MGWGGCGCGFGWGGVGTLCMKMMVISVFLLFDQEKTFDKVEW